MARRWRRWVVGTLAVLAVLLLAAWLALPMALAAGVRKRLPLAVDRTLTVTHADTAPSRLPAEAMARVVVAAAPGRIATLAAEAGQPVPRLLLRDGLCLRAAWRDEREVPELPAELVAVIARAADPPQVALAVPAEPLAALIERTAEPVQFGGTTLRWTYRLDPGTTLASDGPPVATATGVRRRFRAQASGLVTAWLDGAVCEIRVTKLVGHVDLDLDRQADGWRLHGTADVETIESRIERCESPLLEHMAGGLEGVLELLLNSNVLSEQARRHDVLPPWFPTDVVVQAAVVATPGDCAATAAAMLPLR